MPAISAASSSSEAPARTRPRRSWPAHGEETRVELAVGRQPRPRAVAAERLRDRGDDPDLATAVPVAVALRDLAAIGGVDRLEGKVGVDRRHDLGRRHDVVQPPAVGMADIHVLDEAQRVPGSVEVAGQLEDRRLVEALA